MDTGMIISLVISAVLVPAMVFWLGYAKGEIDHSTQITLETGPFTHKVYTTREVRNLVDTNSHLIRQGSRVRFHLDTVKTCSTFDELQEVIAKIKESLR